jgi:hypothetical protein
MRDVYRSPSKETVVVAPCVSENVEVPSNPGDTPVGLQVPPYWKSRSSRIATFVVISPTAAGEKGGKILKLKRHQI